MQPGVEREYFMDISDKEFEKIVSYIKIKYGINLIEKRTLIVGRLNNYLTENGYHNYAEYMQQVERDITGNEARNLINALTTNHTYFMRESEHFEFFKDMILPKLKDSEKKTKDIRIWSAAASTGEEPYTIAMILKDFFWLESSQWDTKVLATDISTQVLQMAIQGRYMTEQIAALPDVWKRRYFSKFGQTEWEIKQILKNEVIFRVFNLMNSFPFKRKFHVIFLRNVMIYFDEQTKNQLLKKIYNQLEYGGYLFIGTTEAVDKEIIKLKYIQPAIYQKI